VIGDELAARARAVIASARMLATTLPVRHRVPRRRSARGRGLLLAIAIAGCAREPGASASSSDTTSASSGGSSGVGDGSSDASGASSGDGSASSSSTATSATGETGDAPGGSGLQFPPNGMPGSDARLVWAGADMLPRTSHTAIWQARYVQQAGYYAVAWHTSNDGTWHASPFEFGTHPYPTTGTVDASGQSTGGTGSVGREHFFEIAGLGASDFIASPGPGPTYALVPEVWVTQARTAEVVGDQVRHRYWPDLADPDGVIEQSFDLAAVMQAQDLAVDPAFTLGGSPWTGDGVVNVESPACVLRGLALFAAPLGPADLVAEATSDSDTAVTAAGQASVWYIHRSPTPDDVDDRSGAGHSPVWANDQRPGLFEPG
jgi:hypothetical protein